MLHRLDGFIARQAALIQAVMSTGLKRQHAPPQIVGAELPMSQTQHCMWIGGYLCKAPIMPWSQHAHSQVYGVNSDS